jgi:hypothetical protein
LYEREVFHYHLSRFGKNPSRVGYRYRVLWPSIHWCGNENYGPAAQRKRLSSVGKEKSYLSYDTEGIAKTEKGSSKIKKLARMVRVTKVATMV